MNATRRWLGIGWALLSIVGVGGGATGQESIEYPRPSDEQYAAHQNELEQWYQSLRRGDREATPTTLYRYILPRNETAIQIAATFSLPYESIVTLNHLFNNNPLLAGSEVLIPSAPGLYIDLNPTNDFERLLHILRIDSQLTEPTDTITVTFRQQEYRYRFIPGAQFSTVERSAFFNRLFHVPVRNGRVSSLFGSRKDPITGEDGFHNGVDIAAALSTPIRAAQEGRVISIENDDPIYGNFIRIQHAGSLITTYAHLQSITTEIGKEVTVSSQIGTVGNTGHSTGAHIHFEIALKGRVLNPLNYMYIPRNYLIEDGETFKRIE